MSHNLEERTAIFGEAVIGLCKTVKRDVITVPIIGQLVRSGTSIGANYMEANGASSMKDFRNKIFICKKESQETKHRLRMIDQYTPENKADIKKLLLECQELIMIFQKITSTLRENW